MIEQIASLERLGDEYCTASSREVLEDLADDLAKVLPKHLQQTKSAVQHGNTSTFHDIKDEVLFCERGTLSWSKDRVLLGCGASAPTFLLVQAMEVNMLQKGKSKKGKGDKGKGRGKGSSDKGKSKGIGKGKGKSQSRPYDAQKGQSKGYSVEVVQISNTQHTLQLQVSPPRLVFNCWSSADATFNFAAKPC